MSFWRKNQEIYWHSSQSPLELKWVSSNQKREWQDFLDSMKKEKDTIIYWDEFLYFKYQALTREILIPSLDHYPHLRENLPRLFKIPLNEKNLQILTSMFN